MKGMWFGVLVIVAGIVWDGASHDAGHEVEHGGGFTLSGGVILLGILLVLATAIRLRKSTQGWLFSLTAVVAAAAVVGWVWDYTAYHWLDMDNSLQFIAHILYNGGTLALIVLSVILTVARVLRQSPKKDVPAD